MMNKTKLGYEDITIVPERISQIRHRRECFCYDANLTLPIFAAPMDNVVDIESAKILSYNRIYPVIPRTIPFEERIMQIFEEQLDRRIFFAFSLTEAQDLFLKDLVGYCYSGYLIAKVRGELEKENDKSFQCRICIDIANGHMSELLETIKSIKEKYGRQVIIMSGNIANPKTYEDYEKAGCDYVRCSIGSGSRCTTSANLGLHYPVFSLLKEIWEIKQKINGKCKIIADGGIKGYRDIQKALLYADYVMIGSLFNKAIDSAGTPIYGKSYWNIFGKRILNPFKTLFTYGKKVKPEKYEKILKDIKLGKVEVWKEYYGMSTKKAQAKINPNAILKTSEGFVKRQKVEYSIKQWVENEFDYLRSVMSYTNSKTLNDYKNSKWVINSYRAYND